MRVGEPGAPCVQELAHLFGIVGMPDNGVSFTLDRYGHLYPEADRALRDRLDRFHEAAGDAE
jgi:hypothetical protein